MNSENNTSMFENDMRMLYREVMATCIKFESLLEKFRQSSLVNEKAGVSLFNVKSDTMFTYINNVIYLILKKCCGMSIKDEETRERMGEIRVILEKIKPVELKLKYQIEKYIKMTSAGDNDVLKKSDFRARMENLELNEEYEAEENDNDESEEEKVVSSTDEKEKKIYKPPKVAAVPYDDSSERERQKKMLERSKKRALSTSIMQELKEEFLDSPLEISNTITLRNKLTNYQREREKYEETYFTRLPTTRKDKHRDKLMANLTVGTLGTEVTRFEDISALEERMPCPSKKRKKRTAIKKKVSKNVELINEQQKSGNAFTHTQLLK